MLTPPTEIELTECRETSARKNSDAGGITPKERIRHSRIQRKFENKKSPHSALSSFTSPHACLHSHAPPRGFTAHILLLYLFMTYQAPAEYLHYKFFTSEGACQIE